MSGDLHEIEIWFAMNDGILYLLSGGGDRSDWVRNLRVNAHVTIRIGTEARRAQARVVTQPGEDELARRLLVEKYRSRYSGELDEWRRTSLPVAIEWALGELV